MIRIPDNLTKATHFLLGNPEHIEDAPNILFHPLRIDFLADLSKELISGSQSKAFPDLVTFAFWCRRANIESVAKRWDNSRLRVGLGLVFHVTPSNVPINFAYSLIFAFLSGNASVVRLPSRESTQCDLVIEALQRLLREDKYQSLLHTIHLLRYDKADQITEFWLQNSLGRVVWGGDATVAHIRSLKSHPRSREIAFVDRYSVSVVKARDVMEADLSRLHELCVGLYNDVYLMDQQACSSPQLMVWIGSQREISAAQSKLWPAFQQYVKGKYSIEPVHAMDKYVGLCREVIDHQNISSVVAENPLLYRIQLDSLAINQCQQRGYFGTIHEFSAEDLKSLAQIVDARFQTMTYFGFKQEALRQFVTSNRLPGVDRVVPIGRALEMGFYWDGFDIISSLSRQVEIQ